MYYIEASDTMYDALNLATVLSLLYAIDRMQPLLQDLDQALQGN